MWQCGSFDANKLASQDAVDSGSADESHAEVPTTLCQLGSSPSQRQCGHESVGEPLKCKNVSKNSADNELHPTVFILAGN